MNAQLSMFATTFITKDKGETINKIGTPVNFKGEIVGKVVSIESNHFLQFEVPDYNTAMEIRKFYNDGKK